MRRWSIITALAVVVVFLGYARADSDTKRRADLMAMGEPACQTRHVTCRVVLAPPLSYMSAEGVYHENDGDGDGWTDGYEFTYIGTAPGLRCEPEDYLPGRVEAWPPDFNRDNAVTGFDLSVIAFNIGKLTTTDALERLDIGNEEMGDAAITAADLMTVAGRIGASC